VKPAQTYIENPLTPLNIAGMARRPARRAYLFGGGYPYAAPYQLEVTKRFSDTHKRAKVVFNRHLPALRAICCCPSRSER
jgi:hypothetical protein